MTSSGGISKRELAQHLLRLRDAQDTFEGYVRLHYPKWELPSFQLKLIHTLDAFERGELECNNILITMPPRHAKSTFSTVLFPCYYMARDPLRYAMTCSYNAQLATDFGRQVRMHIENPLTGQAFPDLHLSKESRAADTWRTEEGGAYFAVGIGGTTSGRPANLLIVDDPIKSREEAESITVRNRVWDYYSSALTTRLQPQSSGKPHGQIVILTRWHPDDLAGRIMKSQDWAEGRWMHINFPAIVEVPKAHPTSRRRLPPDHPQYLDKDAYTRVSPTKRYIQEMEERPLWPERFSLDELKRRERLNPREFASLYQQRPYIEGGNLIKTEWWQTYPDDMNPENFQTLIIGVDTAFKKTENADFSVAMVAGMDRNGDIYIVDIMRGKYDFPELKQRLTRLNSKWRGRGLRGIYIEDKASGQSLLQELKRQSGMSVIPYKVVHDKVARVNATLPLIQSGRVLLPESAPWLDDFVNECVTFPGANHDDQVDALTICLDVLSRTHVSPEAWALSADTSQSLNAQANPSGLSSGPNLSPLGKSLKGTIDNTMQKWRGWGR